ncbi:hypothetical protein FOYG_07498 [Fusarium oxysporum NRRL 32931]|uniref:Uncharacterized protein n=1 Tax=Fusarium oxysporum NRRL 32931 TaxID=660029 RepID=W9I5E5_FUSOX|nr:hypothetical protein FOYG_07498 [Fusarium oxysporum NRRL 32931]
MTFCKYSPGPETSWKICNALSSSFSFATWASSGASGDKLIMGASRSKLGSGSLLARRYPFKVVVFLLRSWTKTSRGDRAACPLTPLVPLKLVPLVPLVPLEMPFETMLGDVIGKCQDKEDNVELLLLR